MLRLAHATLFALLVLISSFCPPIHAGEMDNAVEDWGKARSLTALPGPWRDWLAWRKTQLRKWMTASNDDLNEPVGWMHDYIDPTGKATLHWTKEHAIPTRTQAKARAAWVAHYRAYNFRQLIEAARLYRLTGDTAFKFWALDQLDRYAAGYKSLPLNNWGGKARIMYQTLDEALILIDALEAIRILRYDISNDKLDYYKRYLVNPIIENFKTSNMGGNISIWQATATYISGLVFDDRSLRDRGLTSEQGLLRLIESGITKDGFWHESSLSYQAYVVRAIYPAVMNAKREGQTDAYETLRKACEKLISSAMSLRVTTDVLPNPSDSIGKPEFLSKQLYLDIFRGIPTDIGAEAIKTTKNWDALLAPEGKGTALQLNPLKKQSRNFEDSRFAMLHNKEWTAFFKYGDKSGRHAHADKFNVDIFFNGTAVIADPGTTAYGNALHDSYFKRAAAHNTVTLNGTGPKKWGGEQIDFNSSKFKITASDANFAPGMMVSRRIEIDLNGITQTTSVKNSNKNESQVAMFFSTDCAPKIPTQSDAPPRGPKAIPDGYENVQVIWSKHSTQYIDFALDCNQNLLRLSIESTTKGSFSIGLAPKHPSTGERRYTFAFESNASAFVSTLKVQQQIAQ
jgi:oligo-alginate lyase